MPQLSHQLMPANSLPAQPTLFIGRKRETEAIDDLLHNPACRLITLLGPGGIGKTRLAIQVASQQAANYAQGVCFVDLQPVDSASLLVSAIADALAFPLSGTEALSEQLCRYLRDKELLLLLDNFEQLLAEEGEAILEEMLQAAPGLTCLVTSREALHLQEEWLYPLRGLSFLQDKVGRFTPAESVLLFEERARHARPDFVLTEEAESVGQICQLVEGVPLAIELAASWTKLLSCEEIAREIAESLDILTTPHHNVPDRQQSMRLMFAQTWQRMSQSEQEIFKQLSVFRGDFDYEAARQVAGASLPLLSVLQDKSLLRRRVNGRYHIHELLRQYAAEQLAQSPTELAQIRDAHCAYYAAFLHSLEETLMGPQQVEATVQIETELENVRNAWQWAVRQAKIPEIKQAAFALGNFYQFRSRYAEALAAFEPASAELLKQPETEGRDLALLDTLMVRSWFYLRFGQFEEIKAVMRQSQTIHRKLGIRPAAGYVTDPTIMLAFVSLIEGHFVEAEEHAQLVRQNGQEQSQWGNLEFGCYLLAQIALAQGDYAAAQSWAQEAYAVNRTMQDDWFMAYILNTLADLAFIQREYAAAQRYYETSYAARREFNDAEGMATALTRLSDIALQQENFGEAQNYFEESLRLYQEINDTGGLAVAYAGLGDTAVAQNKYEQARQHYYQSLQLAVEIWFVTAVLHVFIGTGELLCRAGRPTEGLRLLAVSRHHSGADQECKNKAGHLFDSFKLQVKQNEVKRIVAQSRAANLEDMAQALLIDLALPEIFTVSAPPEPDAADDANQALTEPLTARELDVLQLLVAGLSNKEIAERLVLAEGTVKYYTRQIYGKLQVKNRIQATAVARNLNLA